MESSFLAQELSGLDDLGAILVGATLCALLGRPLRVPSVVAFILAGLALGPGTGLVGVTETVAFLSEAGIALLLFVVGLELSVPKVRDVGRVALLAGSGQVVLTMAGGFVLARILGFGTTEALFLGLAVTFSSTAVVVKLLDQKRELHVLYGRIAVGIFLVQDIVVILTLTFLAGFGSGAVDVAGLVRGLAGAFGGMALLLAAAVFAARVLLRRPFRWIARTPEGLFVWSLAWCFLFILGAELLHLSVEIGAFLAGMSLADLPYGHELRRRAHPLMTFFLAVFFVTLGIGMEVEAALRHPGAVLALSAFVLLGKALLFYGIITLLGYDLETSFLASVTVAQVSEFSFILAAMGRSAGLIGDDALAVIGMVGLVTIAVSAYGIRENRRLLEAVRRRGWLERLAPPVGWRARARGRAAGRDGTAGESGTAEHPVPGGHVIVVGMNSLGRILAVELTARGERVLAVDTDPSKLEGLPCPTLLGNVEYPSVLEEAGLPAARLLVSALNIEETNLLLLHRALRAGVPASIHAFSLSTVEELMESGATHLLVSRDGAVRRIAGVLREAGVLG